METQNNAVHIRRRPTVAACYLASVTQAAVCCLAPLLFVIFNTRFSLALDKIGLLVSLGFVLQILTDFAASRFVPKIGFRVSAVAAHILCAAGLLMLGLLPLCMPIFPALILAYVVTNIGGGLLEVITSPIVDGISDQNNSRAISLLHSFYCWGVVAVVGLTTPVDVFLPDELWYLLPVLWTALPAANAILFCFVYLPKAQEETSEKKSLFKNKLFWIMGVLMLASGAAEQAISQWASLFTETAIGVDKALGDLLGMGAFAVLMGVARLLYGIFGARLKLRLMLTVCAAVNIGAYLLTVFAPVPAVSLIGCALCGLSIGMAWPGVLSLSARRVDSGATMFAYMALFGDVGCALGPGMVGWVSESGAVVAGSALKAGLLTAVVFPVVMFLFLLLFVRSRPDPNRLPLDGQNS